MYLLFRVISSADWLCLDLDNCPTISHTAVLAAAESGKSDLGPGRPKPKVKTILYFLTPTCDFQTSLFPNDFIILLRRV